MTETSISVFEEIKGDSIVNISKEERSIVFEKLKETTTEIDDTYFDDFEILINNYLEQYKFITSSTVIEFIILTLIEYPFIYPVIEIDESFVSKLKQPPIKIKTTHHKACFLIRHGNYVEYVSPPDNEINIIGIKIQKIKLDHLPIKFKDILLEFSHGNIDMLDISLYNLRKLSNNQILGFDAKSLHDKLDKEILISVLNRLYKLLLKYDDVAQLYYKYIIYNNIQKNVIFEEPVNNLLLLNTPNEDKQLSLIITPNINPVIKYFDQKLLDKSNINLDELSKVFDAKFTTYNDNHLLELSATLNRSLPLYLLSEVKGRKNEIYSSFVDGLEYDKNKKIALSRLRKEAYIEYNKLQNIYRAMQDVFSSKKWIEVQSLLKNKIHNSNNIFDILSASDTKLVKAKIKTIEIRINNIFNNKCPHIKILRKFRTAINNNDKKKLLFSLQKFFKSNKKAIGGNYIGGSKAYVSKNNPTLLNESFIVCNVCGFDLICPHVVILEEMNIKREPFINIRAALTPYISNIHVGDDYNCKICAEKISSNDDLEDFNIRTNQSQMNDELKYLIYEELVSILKYVVTKTLINRKSLEKLIINRVYDYIYSAEKTLIKHKLDTEYEIRVKLRLYSNIYVWALITHLTSQNQNIEIGSNNNINAPGKKITKMLEYALKTMLKDKRAVIMNAGANMDFVKSRMIKAYKQMAGEKSLIVQTVKPLEINYQTLMYDPIYLYLHKMYWISMDSNNKKAVDHYAVETVLGKKIKEVSNGIFEGVKYKEYVPKNVKLLSEYKIEDIKKQDWKLLKSSVMKESYLILMDYIINGIYRDQTFIDGDQINAKLKEYREKQLAFTKLENIYLDKITLYYNKPVQMTISSTSNQFVEEEFHLGLLYDEKGNKHVWDTYIYKTGEFTVKQIVKLLDEGKTVVDDLLDMKNSKTGLKLSNVSKLSEEKIKNSLEAKTHITNFYIYYNTRCLEKITHDYVKGTCKYCGMKIEYIDDKFSSESIKFYEKYKTKYFKEIKKENDESNNDNIALLDVKNKSTKISKNTVKDFKDWSFNFKLIVTLNKEFGFNKNVLNLLGLSTGEEWEDIKKGITHTIQSIENTDLRLSHINSYIIMFIDEYYKFKYYKNLLKHVKDHQTLIEHNKIQINNLDKLKDINIGSYWEDIEVFRKQKPLDSPQFALEKLYKLAVDAMDSPNSNIIIKHILSKIIKNESLLANANADDIKIFNIKYVSQVIEREAENNQQDIAAAEKEGVLLSDGIRDDAEDVGDTDEPFNRDAFDMEDDNDENDIIELDDD